MRLLVPSWWTLAWDRFWFAPGSPRNLAGARITFAAYSLWVLLSRNLPEMSGLPPVFWSQVGASARWRYLDFPGHPDLERVLVWITAIALLGAIVGVLPRFSCFVSGLLLYHLAPLESLIWIPHPYARGLTISVIALLDKVALRATRPGGSRPGGSLLIGPIEPRAGTSPQFGRVTVPEPMVRSADRTDAHVASCDLV